MGDILGSVVHRVKIHKITPATGKERGDLEIQDYMVLQKPQEQDECLPPRTLILYFTLTHPRFGRSHVHPQKRKKIHGSWENVWDHFSCHQWSYMYICVCIYIRIYHLSIYVYVSASSSSFLTCRTAVTCTMLYAHNTCLPL